MFQKINGGGAYNMAKVPKVILPESGIATYRYTMQADLPRPLPPATNLGTKQAVGPDDLKPIFPVPVISQKMS